MERKERLELLPLYLEEHQSDVYADFVVKKFREELRTEFAFDSNQETNTYYFNLKQTEEKELANYLEAIRRKKTAPGEYRRFIEHFEADISGGIVTSH